MKKLKLGENDQIRCQMIRLGWISRHFYFLQREHRTIWYCICPLICFLLLAMASTRVPCVASRTPCRKSATCRRAARSWAFSGSGRASSRAPRSSASLWRAWSGCGGARSRPRASWPTMAATRWSRSARRCASTCSWRPSGRSRRFTGRVICCWREWVGTRRSVWGTWKGLSLLGPSKVWIRLATLVCCSFIEVSTEKQVFCFTYFKRIYTVFKIDETWKVSNCVYVLTWL